MSFVLLTATKRSSTHLTLFLFITHTHRRTYHPLHHTMRPFISNMLNAEDMPVMPVRGPNLGENVTQPQLQHGDHSSSSTSTSQQSSTASLGLYDDAGVSISRNYSTISGQVITRRPLPPPYASAVSRPAEVQAESSSLIPSTPNTWSR